MLEQAVDWLGGFVRDVLNWVWRLLGATLFRLPEVTALPQVQEVSDRALVVVNTGYGLAIITAGILVMASGNVQARYSAGELLPRLVLGLVAANFAPWICENLIEAGNALVGALTSQGIATEESLAQLLRILTAQVTTPGAALLSAAVGLTVDFLVLALVVGWISRFAALVVLCGVSPAALACHGLPFTDVVAQLWWRSMSGLIATVVLQAVALNTSLAIYLDPDANLAAIGFPIDPTGLLNLVVIACLLWFTARIPGLVRRFLTQSGGRQNILGAIVRLVIVQQLTRGLGRATRGRPLAGRGRLGSGGSGGPGPRPAPRPRPPGPVAPQSRATGPTPGGSPGRAATPAPTAAPRAAPRQAPSPADTSTAIGRPAGGGAAGATAHGLRPAAPSGGNRSGTGPGSNRPGPRPTTPRQPDRLPDRRTGRPAPPRRTR